jgi:hypothetical protein
MDSRLGDGLDKGTLRLVGGELAVHRGEADSCRVVEKKGAKKRITRRMPVTLKEFEFRSPPSAVKDTCFRHKKLISSVAPFFSGGPVFRRFVRTSLVHSSPTRSQPSDSLPPSNDKVRERDREIEGNHAVVGMLRCEFSHRLALSVHLLIALTELLANMSLFRSSSLVSLCL